MRRWLLGLLLSLAALSGRTEFLYWMGDASEDKIPYLFAQVAVVKFGEEDSVITRLLDPDGNPFCLLDPEGNPSRLGKNEGDFMTGASWADISDYTSNEYGFFVEVMNYGILNTDPTRGDQWYVAGVSDVWSYDRLVSSGFVLPEIMPDIQAAWHPTVVVPEPTSGLLMLVGLSLLALRRRRD